MADHPYPHLGLDPAPGSPPAIAALRTRLTSSAAALATAHRLVSRLLGESAHWHGEAAGAFRTALDGELPRALHNAHRSLTRAAAELGTWHDDLLSHQETARRYESRAALDTASLTRARTHEATLRTAPDTPEPALRAAAEAVESARDSLASVRRLARELDETHRAEASRIAKRLNEATDRPAPREPGVLDKVLEWVEEDLGDVLSDVSAMAGFAALVIGPFFGPVGLALLFVAAGASVGALSLHLTDSQAQKSLRDGFTKGEFDSDFWDSTVTVTGDALGSVPGLAAVAQGAKSATVAVRTAQGMADSGGLAMAHAGAQGFRSGAVGAMDEMRQVENPLTTWALRRTSDTVQKSVKIAFPAAGAATAGSDYGPWSDSETVNDAGTATDGVRAVLDDAPGSAAKAAHVWTAIGR